LAPANKIAERNETILGMTFFLSNTRMLISDAFRTFICARYCSVIGFRGDRQGGAVLDGEVICFAPQFICQCIANGESSVINIAIVVGSTRPGRKARDVADWVLQIAALRNDARFELVDVLDFDLPLLDEEIPPSMGNYQQAHTKTWAARIGGFDGFVFVTPEYNHGTSAALKNAIDFLFAEWNNKAAGFVGYGSAGGARGRTPAPGDGGADGGGRAHPGHAVAAFRL
jgi:hypothetical protein